MLGLTLFNFAPTAAQNLLYQRAVVEGGPNNQYLPFAGSSRTINSIILLSNGISFAIQSVLFLIIGAYADFGTFRPRILIAISIVSWGIGFGWLDCLTLSSALMIANVVPGSVSTRSQNGNTALAYTSLV